MTVIKGISNFGTPYYADKPRYERKNGQWVDTKADIITELEKIKAEIEEKEFKLNCATMSDVALKTVYIEVAKLLDNHISELKEK